MSIFLKSFSIKRFRSLKDVTINFSEDYPIIICGENNIGKTNVLRALDLFFNFDKDLFNPKYDIPYHIYYGSRGAGTNVELEGLFIQEGKSIKIKIRFSINDVKYFLNGRTAEEEDIKKYLNEFRYFFIESNNVNIPELLSSLLEKEGLLPLDKKRKKQSDSLTALDNFIKKSKEAVNSIEKDINKYFHEFTNFDGFLDGKKIKINFAEYERLRDALKNIVSITLQDGNDNGIISKGSGAQRIVLLSLMQYIANKTDKQILWGIDEPEVFLQPKLQKKVNEILLKISEKTSQQIILTSHSPYFINISKLDHTYLFIGKLESKKFSRKPGEIFYEMTAIPYEGSVSEKLCKIKEHLGIEDSDAWILYPNNILVEGITDKKYLETLLRKMNFSIPNIFISNGVSKMKEYLAYLDKFSSDNLKFKPNIKIIFDNDTAGKESFNSIKENKYKELDIEKIYITGLNGSFDNCQIEDFVPQQAIFEAINLILQKEGYKRINKKQMSNKNKKAYQNQNILKYSEDICKRNNQDKHPLSFNEEGRKMQICQKACSLIENNDYKLTDIEENFLKQIRG